jgi:hypothetical protein
VVLCNTRSHTIWFCRFEHFSFPCHQELFSLNNKAINMCRVVRASYVVSGTKWTPYVTCADDIRCVLNWLKLRMTSSDDKEKTSEQTNVLFDPIPVSNRVDNRRRNYQLQVAFEKAKRKDPLVFVFQLLAWETNVATRNLRRVWNGGCWLLTLYL